MKLFTFSFLMLSMVFQLHVHAGIAMESKEPSKPGPNLLLNVQHIVPSQEGKICGYLLDIDTKTPLPNASITVEGTNAFHITDDDGFFQIKNIEEGQTLLIEYFGYKSMQLAYGEFAMDQCKNIFLSSKDKYYARAKRRGVENRQKADELFSKLAFAKAIPIYEEMVKSGYDRIHALRRLAESHLLLRDFSQAIPYFKEFIEEPETPSSFYFKYAMALRSSGDDEGSLFWLKKFEEQNKNDERLKQYLKDGNLVSVTFNSEERYAVTPVHFNTEYSDFGGFMHDGQLYFSSSRPEKGADIYHWNNEPWLDIYHTDPNNELMKPIKISGEINSKFHESSAIFSTDYKNDTIIYFTRNNFFDNKKGFTFKRDEENIIGINNLKIYRAERQDGEWKVTRNLKTNADHYSSGHPTVNTNRTLLYFASNRPGGYGGTDIYYSKIHPRGGLSRPINAGPVINTPGNEMFPFVNNEGKVFFSSDGHPGYGQLDVFGTVVDDEGNIKDVINLGRPLNSEKDDFAFYSLGNGVDGYVSSNRDGGQGGDDIYRFEFTPPLYVSGVVTDAINLQQLEGVKISLSDQENGQLLAETVTDENGYYKMKVDRLKNYMIEAYRKTHPKKHVFFSTKDTPRETTLIVKDIELEPIIDVKILADLDKIYFDFNKDNIRPDAQIELNKVVKLLTVTYPEMVIRLEAHTDPVGSHAYNDQLSERRAKSTYEYLIANGVPRNQIVSYMGFGKRKPINECTGKHDCSPEELELNRRTEFPIIQIQNKPSAKNVK